MKNEMVVCKDCKYWKQTDMLKVGECMNKKKENRKKYYWIYYSSMCRFGERKDV